MQLSFVSASKRVCNYEGFTVVGPHDLKEGLPMSKDVGVNNHY